MRPVHQVQVPAARIRGANTRPSAIVSPARSSSVAHVCLRACVLGGALAAVGLCRHLLRIQSRWSGGRPSCSARARFVATTSRRMVPPTSSLRERPFHASGNRRGNKWSVQCVRSTVRELRIWLWDAAQPGRTSPSRVEGLVVRLDRGSSNLPGRILACQMIAARRTARDAAPRRTASPRASHQPDLAA